MDTGQILHIVVTVIAILGAGAVALVCDLLKSSNERLRQINLELRIRREEEQRRTQLALDQLKRVEATAERALAAVSAGALTEGSPQPKRTGRIGLTAMIASGQPAMIAAGGNDERQTAGAIVQTPPAEGGHDKDAPARQPGGTLEEARLLARGLPATAPGHEATLPPAAAVVAPVVERVKADATIPSSKGFVNGDGGGSSASRKDWDLLLRNAARRRGRPTADPDPVHVAVRHRGELIPFESLQSNQESFHLPGGFYPFAALAHFLASRNPFRGMVIAFAVNGIRTNRTEAGVTAADALVDAVEAYVKSILAPTEFAAPTGRGQFAIVTPDRDAAAQRRFDELTAKLWNYQLRRVATDSELFCCGGFEANGETLADAVDAAAAHMEANRDSQEPPLLETVRRRRAV